MMRRLKVYPVPWTLPGDLDCAAWRRLDAMFCSNESRYPVSPHHFVTPTDRLEIILCHQSFLIRVTDMTTFIERCPPEALKDNFQLIVDSIFSNRNREQAWDLRSMRRADHPREAAAVFKLLAPNGPLMTLALRLMDDHNFLLEFPLDGLPPYLMQKLQRMDIPPFFANKVSVMYDLHRQCNVIHHLSLNPFEYYMFSFASVNLLGINTGRTADYLHGWAVLQDTLYTNLLEEYLVYFFPCDGSGVPCHNFNYAPVESVFLANSLLRQNYAKKPFYGVNYSNDLGSHTTEENLPKLFKSSILQDQTTPNVNRENIYHATHPSAYKEVWRSETILHCFVELWMSAPEDCSVLSDGSKSNISAGPLAYGGLPSVEVVKSVRMLVRHLHYFINCVNTHANHPMEDIRRNSFPLFQIKLYKFLRFTFQYWPLDNSFRIVYETWLSYIQPWRYLRFERRRTAPGGKENEVIIDRRWFSFLTDNILYYSKLFSKVLDRLERVDLSATKNALMFYRVAKVLTSQDSLKTMLVEIESYIHTYLQQGPLMTSSVSSPATVMGSNRGFNFSTPASCRGSSLNVIHGTSRISPVRTCPPSPSFGSSLGLQESALSTSAVKVAHLKQLLKDFESPSYVYEPIFSDKNIKKVCRLLRAAVEARDTLAASASKFNEGAHKSQTWMQWIMGNPSPSQMAIQNANERTKAANQLEYAKNQFSSFFDINQDFLAELPRSSQSFSRSVADFSDASMELNGRSICVDRVSKKAILPSDVLVDDSLIPIGNPDIALIRSDEVGFLVRLLFFISNMLNNVFADQIPRLYFSKGWTGRIARAMLAEPKEYIVRGQGRNKFKRSSRYLPPRIHLRFLASYSTACYLFIAFVLANILGLTPLQWIFVPLALYTAYLTFRAASEPINLWCDLYEKYLQNERIKEDNLGVITRDEEAKPKDQ